MTDHPIRCGDCAHASTNPALLTIARAAWKFQARLHGNNPLLSCYRWSGGHLVFAHDRNPGCFVHRAEFDLAAYYALPPSADPRDDAHDRDDDIPAQERSRALREMFHRVVGS